MSFILSAINRPVGDARHGKSTVFEAVTEKQHAADVAGNYLILHGVSTLAARRFCNALVATLDTGTEITHAGTGITFRIDTEEQAPNVCPCCGRLVVWGDHAYAGSEDAYCLGCFTWSRSVEPCQPGNSAHTTKEN